VLATLFNHYLTEHTAAAVVDGAELLVTGDVIGPVVLLTKAHFSCKGILAHRPFTRIAALKYIKNLHWKKNK